MVVEFAATFGLILTIFDIDTLVPLMCLLDYSPGATAGTEWGFRDGKRNAQAMTPTAAPASWAAINPGA
jgi:hypothetical protein